MTNTKTSPLLLFTFLIGACGGQRDPDAVDLLAAACAVTTDEAVALLAPHEEEECEDEDDGILDGACCSNPGGCEPMEYPDTICYALPGPTDSVVLAKHSEVDTDLETTTMYYENCPPKEGEEPPGEICTEEDGAYVFLADASTPWVARFVTDASGNQHAELYKVPDGGGPVRIPSGGEAQPLLHWDDPYADHDLGVPTPDGTLYVNKMLDCIPRVGGCGFTCWKC
jgi:hypothetical protein